MAFWIKVRNDLPDDPRIAQVAHLLNVPISTAIGCFALFWIMADKHSIDGKLPVGPEALDRLLGVSGFAHSASSVGWLTISDGFVAVPRFSEHNGESAKTRLMKSERQNRWRKGVGAPPSTKRLPERDRETDKSPLEPPQGGAGEGSHSKNGKTKRRRPPTRDEINAAIDRSLANGQTRP